MLSDYQNQNTPFLVMVHLLDNERTYINTFSYVTGFDCEQLRIDSLKTGIDLISDTNIKLGYLV